MFQTTRRRLALWYTTVTAVLLLLFAIGFYAYVRTTLVERIDDTLSHVVEVVERSLVIQAAPDDSLRVNLDASFRSNAEAVEDDHIDLEWFSAEGELQWSTFFISPGIPLRPENIEETVSVTSDQLLRQATRQMVSAGQVLGYLRVSHPWFEVTKPTRQLIRDLGLGLGLMTVAVGAIGWFLSGLAMAPVHDSYQRLRQFTADASHELRNPIAVIQTNVQVALADPDPHLQQDQLRVIERLTRRLGRLVDDLLFLARQDSGITSLQLDEVRLDELLKDVIEEQESIATEKGLALSLQLPEPSGELVQGDRNQLSRLLTNLISNAVQYTPLGGTVEVTLQRKIQNVPHWQIQVKDTGIGIPAEALPQVFDRFYRVDPARSGGKGRSETGLGLAIAKVIVENHQGHIQVDSVVQQGTTFTVLLPCYRPDAV
ncbi:MAG: HAMP domain-containing histidine kinase [Leptolyngbyaceae cyanobacterium CSU_1_4]|nr:HAMP domain-containing histidine kinase [Leptolyngbyaceae cyanobacterium CSU_1_4]